jgi:DNA-binding CsgD family transcriptional regulator
VRLAAEPAARAEAALSSSRVLGVWGHHDAAISVCREALAAGGPLDPALMSRLEGELVSNAWVHPVTAEEALVRTLARSADTGPTNAWRVNLAFASTITGRPAPESLGWLAPMLAEGLGDVAPDSLAAAYVLFVLIWNDELAVAQSICDAVLDSARSRGSMSMVAHASGASAMIALRRGDLERAASDARLALDFKLATSPPLAVAWAAAPRIEALAGLGRFREAEEVAARAAARQPPPGYVHTLTLLQARGLLRCAQARFEEALGDLLEAGAGFARLGGEHPDVASWRLPAAEVSVAIGRRGDAARLAEEHLALARRVGTPRILGSALRGCAGTAEGDRAEELLGEAVELLETTPARIELARALADLGAVRRRAGRRREARDPLLRAAELADGAGAQPLAARVRAELLASGARPRRTALMGPAALTSAERRIADLAAEGLTNRQIAQRLFVTQPTVETHLRHAFQKLGVASRTELASALHPGRAEEGRRMGSGQRFSA